MAEDVADVEDLRIFASLPRFEKCLSELTATKIRTALGPVRAEQLAAKVERQYGWPAADGRGRIIWCEACKKVQPLAQEFDTWAWNKHARSSAHKKAVHELERERLSMANWGMCA